MRDSRCYNAIEITPLIASNQAYVARIPTNLRQRFHIFISWGWRGVSCLPDPLTDMSAAVLLMCSVATPVRGRSVSRASSSETTIVISMCRSVLTARRATSTPTRPAPAPSVCTSPDNIPRPTQHTPIRSSTSANTHTFSTSAVGPAAHELEISRSTFYWRHVMIVIAFVSPKSSFTPDALLCVVVRHRAACCVVFAAYRKTPHRNAAQRNTMHRIRCKRTLRRSWTTVKGKDKDRILLYSATYAAMPRPAALYNRRKWQSIGKSQWCGSAMLQLQHTPPPQINHTRPSPRKHSPDGAARARKQTSDYSLLLSSILQYS